MEEDDGEPAPLVPGRSEPLCVQSGQNFQNEFNAREAPRLLQASTCFGPSKRDLSRSVPVPSPRVRDFSPPPPTEKSMSVVTKPIDEEKPGNTCHLHKAVWLADRPRIDQLLKATADINEVDTHGATPIMLAVELLPRAREYDGIIRQLLEHGSDPRLRSAQGWSPLDEAVSRGDEQLVRTLFEGTQRNLSQRWEKRLASIAASLQLLPDFECRIRWEFESPLLPLLNKVAPSDVVQLRKRGTSLRVDSTLASWKRFRLSKRRDLTTLFRGPADGSPAGSLGRLCMINHTKKTAVDVTEGLDSEESGAVLGDLVSADVMQWDMQVDDLEVAEAKTWLGATAGICDIGDWKAMRYEVQGALGLSVRKKGRRRNGMTFQEYFGCALPPDACLPELRDVFREDRTPLKLSREPSKNSDWSGETSEFVGTFDLFDQQAAASPGAFGLNDPDVDNMSSTSEVLQQWPDAKNAATKESDSRDATKAKPRHRRQDERKADALLGGRRANIPTEKDRTGKTTHRVNASVWLATDFAIPMQQFLPVLEALSMEHEIMRRLKELLGSQSLKEAALRAQQAAQDGGGSSGGHVFPVRASVPLNLAVRAIVHFEAFELKPRDSLPAELFDVPADYQWMPRCEAQKTPNRAKKRMLLANLAL